MNGEANESPSREQRLQEVLVACVEAAEKGQAVDRQALLARYPEFASELAEFFAGRDRIDLLTDPLWAPAPAASDQAACDRETATLAPTPSADAGLQPGTTVRYFGDYELLAEIARGGMGVVYKARQVSLNRIVALKMILAGQLASAADVQRFRTEAEAAANLDHPNIVPIYEIGEHQGQHYFSMKLIEGGSLGEQVARFSQDPTDAAQLLMTVARAVHHAHQRGILHRDLKPGNILVDGQGQPHVTDFGLAKRVQGDSRLTQSGAIVGTPSYMAPEQARSEKVLTTAVDIYSLGAILYELLTGRPPFKAGTPLDTVLQVLEREPERPRVLNPRTDHDLETICLKCLEKEPHNRYGSAEAVAEDLERWLASEPIHARRTAAWERGLKWMQRRPAIAALTSLLAVSGVLGAGGVIWQWREAEAARQEALAKASAEEQAKTEAQQAQEAEERQRQQAQAALARAERSLYFQRIALAERYWLANNLGRAEEYLDACPLALRHWEWHYLKHLCHAEAVSLRGYPNYEAAYTPDGRLLATTGPDNTILLLDRATWQVARVLRGHQRPVEKLALSGDGRTLASVSQDGMIKLWSVESAQELRTWTARSVVDLAIDRDGRRVAAATQRTAPYGGAELILHRPGEVILWDGEGQQLLRIPGAGTNVALSPDGKQIVSFSENVLVPGGAVRIWDATTGELVSTLRQLHYPQARTAFSQDGRWLVAVDDKTAVLWDAATSKQLRSLTGHTSQINHVAFSHDGRRLATADREGMIKLWNPDRGEELFTYRAHKGPVGSVALSPDGQQLASTGADGTLRIWDATQGQQVRRLRPGTSGPFLSLAFSPDSKRLALAGNETLPAFQLFSGSAKGEVVLYDFAIGHASRTFQPETRPFRLGPVGVYRVAYSPDGKRLACGNPNGTINIWDAETGKELCRCERHGGPIMSLVFSPDGQQLVTADAGAVEPAFEGGGILISRTVKPGVIKVWDAVSGRERRTLEVGSSSLTSVVFSPDGRLLAAANVKRSGGIQLWDAATGQEILHFAVERAPGAHFGSEHITTLAFSPDGQRLASASWDQMVRLWDPATGKEVSRLLGHTDYVWSLAFSADGQRLVSLGGGTLKLWEPATGQEILSLSAEGDNSTVAFRPDSQMIAVPALQGVKVWDAPLEIKPPRSIGETQP